MNETVEQYRERLLAMQRPFLLPRRFVSNDSWTKATTQDGGSYIGVFREYEPDLTTILRHQHVVIVGDPGAGKSATAKAILWSVLDSGQGLPVAASLKSYEGDLRNLLGRQAPVSVLGDANVTRTHVLDGVDELPREHRTRFQQDIRDLIANDPDAKIVITSRQAFAAQNPDVLPPAFTTFHLLDFDEHDIKAYVEHHHVNLELFLAAVRAAECEEEISNPFVLGVLLNRFQQDNQLSGIRSNNVKYVIDALISSRPHFNATRQRRALRMLATACETAARNELTFAQAERVLLEAIDFPRDTAIKLLDELSHSILIRTGTGISFQMRSYGEFLAAEELHDKGFDRLRELAFTSGVPVDSWLNTVTYLAEMSDGIRRYFARQYPRWLIDVSPAAFSDDERTELVTELLRETNRDGVYLVEQASVSGRRLARLLTPTVVTQLRNQLRSGKPDEVANAILLLGIRKDSAVVPQALGLVTADRNPSSLRYSAIVALINAASSDVVEQLIDFAHDSDPYHIHIIDAIGSLCTAAQFPQVLPLLRHTNAGLSSTYYHFREFKSRAALESVIAFLDANPSVLHGFDMDSYLQPIVDQISDHWDEQLAVSIGTLLTTLERSRTYCYSEKLISSIITQTARNDDDGTAIRTMLAAVPADESKILFSGHLVAPLVNVPAAQWIRDSSPEHAQRLFFQLPPGPARDILDPRTPDQLEAQAEYTEEQRRNQRERDHQQATTRNTHQDTVRTSDNLYSVLNAFVRLPKEHYPDLTSERRIWLAHQVGDELVRLDLANNIVWTGENSWRRPPALAPLLGLTDYYNLVLANDVPIALALRSWADKEIANYYRKNGWSAGAKAVVADLLATTQNLSIPQNVIAFLRQTDYSDTAICGCLVGIVNDPSGMRLRGEAFERLAQLAPDNDVFVTLATDRDPEIQKQAFRHLVKRQDQATTRRALASITDEDLSGVAGSQIFNVTDLDWLADVKAQWAIDDLKRLRRRALGLNVPRTVSLITNTIANIDKNLAAATIETQLRDTPNDARQRWAQEAEKLRREARTEAVLQTPFDTVIKKLKGSTSMIEIKVWCEGATDRPVFRRLLMEAGENEIASTIDFVGGWPNLLAEKQPERWLDGCRQAVIIMDGDNGRKLKNRNQPYTDQAKGAFQTFAPHAITLYVLKKYGIENYFPRHACEAVLLRDLAAYFPIPADAAIEKHFSEPRHWANRLLNRIFRRPSRSFYRKKRSEEIASRLTMGDIHGTDLADIINELVEKTTRARQF